METICPEVVAEAGEDTATMTIASLIIASSTTDHITTVNLRDQGDGTYRAQAVSFMIRILHQNLKPPHKDDQSNCLHLSELQPQEVNSSSPQSERRGARMEVEEEDLGLLDEAARTLD